MKLSALITKLTEIKSNFGDVEVLTLRANQDGQMVDVNLDVVVDEDADGEANSIALVAKDTL